MTCLLVEKTFNCPDFYNETDLLLYATIDTTYDNLLSIINYTLDIMLNINYVFLLDESVNTLILYRIADGAIRTFSIAQFIQAYSKYIIKSDLAIKNYLVSLVKGTKNTKWSNKIQQEKHGVYQKISSLYYKQYIDTDISYQKHSSNKDLFIEIPVYNSENTYELLSINYDITQFIKIDKRNLHLSYKQYNNIDYGILINNNIFAPFYKKSDILIIHKTKKLYNTGVGLFIIDNALVIKKYHIIKDEQGKTIIELFSINSKQNEKISMSYKKSKIFGDILCYVRNIK